MNTIYLVCTRSAITASALTYIINSSPDCYNLSHNNLWLTEESEWFGTAHIINDWWNISDQFKNSGYDAEFRNADALTRQQLVRLSDAWKNINTGKNICLFTHARNVQEIMQIRDQHHLPIAVITTIMGPGSYQFLSGVLRREFNEGMNDYQGVLAAWDHIYNQLTVQDDFWSAASDVTFKMRDWLIDTQKIYQSLNLASNSNIAMWCEQYLRFNNMDEEFETQHDVIFGDHRPVYKLQLFSYLVLRYRDLLSSGQLSAYAKKLPEILEHRPKIFDFTEFADAAMERAGIPVDKRQEIIYSDR
jgi:hypothetical protein